MTPTTPSREDWETRLNDISYTMFPDGNPVAMAIFHDFITDLLQNRDNALVAEIEKLKEQRNEIYKMTVEHFSNEQEKVSFFKKFVDIIKIIQKK